MLNADPAPIFYLISIYLHATRVFFCVLFDYTSLIRLLVMHPHSNQSFPSRPIFARCRYLAIFAPARYLALSDDVSKTPPYVLPVSAQSAGTLPWAGRTGFDLS